jgi:hypothetical protein
MERMVPSGWVVVTYHDAAAYILQRACQPRTGNFIICWLHHLLRWGMDL